MSYHGGDHVFGVLAVHDAESLTKTDCLGMAAEDTVSNRVEGAAPEPIGGSGKEVVHTLRHLASGLVCKSEKEDGSGGNALLEDPSHTICEGSGFSTARSGNDKCRSAGICDGGELLIVQFGGVVDAAGGSQRRLQCVGTGHAGVSLARDAKS